ncbi:MAG: potassium channel protein [Calditrichaeota bacterium]|nr:MAG: potassium channel protein [Calditrichota bacterium]
MEQIKRATYFLLTLILLGSIGYMIIEKWNFLDSLYMTLISITTTGFNEVHPLSYGGRILTMTIIITGVGTIAYIGGRAAQLIIETQIFRRRRVDKKVEKTQNHYIVCGYGRLGNLICDELAAQGIPFVVIENDDARIDDLIENEYLFVNADATTDEGLIKAGIDRARGLVAVLPTDAENLYTTLSAKVLNPNIFVVTRAVEEETEKKLIRAGANRVVKPYEIGANRMVNLLLRPSVADFIDIVSHQKGVDLGLEEVVVGPNSFLKDKTIAESEVRKRLNIIIVAIRRPSGEFIYNPTPDVIIYEGDRLLAIGQIAQLNQLNQLS